MITNLMEHESVFNLLEQEYNIKIEINKKIYFKDSSCIIAPLILSDLDGKNTIIITDNYEKLEPYLSQLESIGYGYSVFEFSNMVNKDQLSEWRSLLLHWGFKRKKPRYN